MDDLERGSGLVGSPRHPSKQREAVVAALSEEVLAEVGVDSGDPQHPYPVRGRRGRMPAAACSARGGGGHHVRRGTHAPMVATGSVGSGRSL
jgi:hypothetical protein